MSSDEEEEEEMNERVKQLIVINERLAPAQHRAVRQEYQKLLEDAQREMDNDPGTLEQINEILEEADILYAKVCRPREALLDAKLLNIHSNIVKQRINKIQAGNEFNTSQFVQKMTWMLHGTSSSTENEDVLFPADWVKLGKITSSFVNQTPKLNFLYGTFPQSSTELNRTIQRRVRDQEERAALSHVKATDPLSREVLIDQTAVEVRYMQYILHRVYEREGRPLCFFKFIIDPYSFRKTIENMFHFATLIKDGSAQMFLGPNDTPVIEPLDQNSSATTVRHDSHVLLPMTYKRWKTLVKLFRVTEATIPPIPK